MTSESPPRHIEIIGIGAGSPDHLTLQAIEAIRRCQVFLVADKGDAKRQLVAAREAVVDRWGGEDAQFITVPDPQRGPDAERGSAEYADAVRAWHAARTDAYVSVIEAQPDGAVIGFLVWGDPAFYDSTIRIVDAIGERIRTQVHVTPGISAFQALAAAHGIVLHEVGAPVHVTTGRKLIETYREASSAVEGAVVVMLDGHLACRDLVASHPDLTIVWGAQLGLPSERLVRGRLADVIEQITTVRAQTRTQDGWVMDVYALMP